jgi:hypothetical protein
MSIRKFSARDGAALIGLPAVALAALAATLVAVPDAAASQAGVPGTVVVQSNAHGSVLKAAPGIQNKQALIHSLAAARMAPATADLSLNHNVSLSPFNSETITPPGGNPGEIFASGTSFVEVPFFEGSANFTQNQSTVAWLGLQPFNADNVIQTDEWQVDTFGFSVTVSDPPSGSVSTSNGDVQWQTTVADNWMSTHSWDQVGFDAGILGSIYSVRFNETGAFQFGSSFFATTGSDSATV